MLLVLPQSRPDVSDADGHEGVPLATDWEVFCKRVRTIVVDSRNSLLKGPIDAAAISTTLENFAERVTLGAEVLLQGELAKCRTSVAKERDAAEADQQEAFGRRAAKIDAARKREMAAKAAEFAAVEAELKSKLEQRNEELERLQKEKLQLGMSLAKSQTAANLALGEAENDKQQIAQLQDELDNKSDTLSMSLIEELGLPVDGKTPIEQLVAHVRMQEGQIRELLSSLEYTFAKIDALRHDVRLADGEDGPLTERNEAVAARDEALRSLKTANKAREQAQAVAHAEAELLRTELGKMEELVEMADYLDSALIAVHTDLAVSDKELRIARKGSSGSAAPTGRSAQVIRPRTSHRFTTPLTKLRNGPIMSRCKESGSDAASPAAHADLVVATLNKIMARARIREYMNDHTVLSVMTDISQPMAPCKEARRLSFDSASSRKSPCPSKSPLALRENGKSSQRKRPWLCGEK